MATAAKSGIQLSARSGAIASGAKYLDSDAIYAQQQTTSQPEVRAKRRSSMSSIIPASSSQPGTPTGKNTIQQQQQKLQLKPTSSAGQPLEPRDNRKSVMPGAQSKEPILSAVNNAAAPTRRRAPSPIETHTASPLSPQGFAKPSGRISPPPAPPLQSLEEPPTLGQLSAQTVEDMAIRVVVRKRPVSRGELGRGDKDVLEIQPGGVVTVHEPKLKVDLTKIVESQTFVFDDAFEAHETNELIYRCVRSA